MKFGLGWTVASTIPTWSLVGSAPAHSTCAWSTSLRSSGETRKEACCVEAGRQVLLQALDNIVLTQLTGQAEADDFPARDMIIGDPAQPSSPLDSWLLLQEHACGKRCSLSS